MIVETKYGKLQGITGNGYTLYKGVPYASPPIGKLRWMPPQPVQSWEGVRKATEYRGKCIQRPRQPGSFYDKEFSGEDNAFGMTEDCLYLNIWVPETLEKQMPVAFYIHGGAFLSGCGDEKEFDGKALTEKGVILVTINYRLGVWGFLAHPWLSDESEQNVSGNYGILDQLAALQWIKENIAAFGGNPENITVMGQSAGAISVLTLASCQFAKGLFQRAIIQSGLGLDRTNSLKQAEAEGEEFAKLAGVKSLEEMRELSVDAILQASGPIIMKGFQGNGGLIYAPITDGWLVPELSENDSSSKHVLDIPYIVGSNSNDMLTSVESLANGDKGPMYKGTEDFAHRVSNCQSSPIYVYYFQRQLPGDDAGAFHSAELWYTFGSLNHCWRPMKEEDYELSAEMVYCWTQFMKTGNPNVPDTNVWQAYTEDNPYIHIWDVNYKDGVKGRLR